MCMNVYRCTVLMPGALRSGKEHYFFWNWNYRWLRSAMWVLGIKVGSSERADRALNPGAISFILVRVGIF